MGGKKKNKKGKRSDPKGGQASGPSERGNAEPDKGTSEQPGDAKAAAPARICVAPEPGRLKEIGWAGFWLANALILTVLVFALLTNRYETSAFDFLTKLVSAPDDLPYAESTDLYYRLVQEDEVVEWATFWGFVFAAGMSLFAGWRQWRNARQWPWFLGLVALFCLLFALEEISWGQRVFAYRPPVYFLEHNFQQEFNVHNVIETSTRKLLLKLIILGYGVVLPALSALPPVRRIFAQTGVITAPLALVPSFFIAYWVYEAYPWDFSGELVELMLALGFLFSAVVAARLYRAKPTRWVPERHRDTIPFALAFFLTLGAGIAHAGVTRAQRAGNPELVRQARQETEALAADFLEMARRRGGRLTTGCGLHKRLFAYVNKFGRRYLLHGRFASLVRQGLPEERAEYFLDPWNNPYWIRHKCEDEDDPDSRVSVFVYSFGPNRKRDSSGFELRGDDVGTYILRLPEDLEEKKGEGGR